MRVRALFRIQNTIQVTRPTASNEAIPTNASSAALGNSRAVVNKIAPNSSEDKTATLTPIWTGRIDRPDPCSAPARMPTIRAASKPSRKAINRVEIMLALH